MTHSPTTIAAVLARALQPRYYERQRYRGWNVQPTPLMEYRLLRHWCDKATHLQLAGHYLTRYLETSRRRRQHLDRCAQLYGRQGTLYAAGTREHWPESAKQVARMLAGQVSDFASASLAHWQAGGRRVHTWRRLRDDRAKQ